MVEVRDHLLVGNVQVNESAGVEEVIMPLLLRRARAARNQPAWCTLQSG
jgi:hypothetical protein